MWPDSHGLNNRSSTTSLYALTSSVRGLKFGLNKVSYKNYIT